MNEEIIDLPYYGKWSKSTIKEQAYKSYWDYYKLPGEESVLEKQEELKREGKNKSKHHTLGSVARFVKEKLQNDQDIDDLYEAHNIIKRIVEEQQ